MGSSRRRSSPTATNSEWEGVARRFNPARHRLTKEWCTRPQSTLGRGLGGLQPVQRCGALAHRERAACVTVAIAPGASRHLLLCEPSELAESEAGVKLHLYSLCVAMWSHRLAPR